MPEDFKLKEKLNITVACTKFKKADLRLEEGIGDQSPTVI